MCSSHGYSCRIQMKYGVRRTEDWCFIEYRYTKIRMNVYWRM